MVGRGRTVLVVEDDRLTLGLLAEILTQAGFVVGAADTVAQARVMWDRMDPDAVVLDVDLGPGVNGFDLADAFTAQTPSLAVLFLSTLPDARFAGRNPDSLPVGVGYVRKDQISQPRVLDEALDASCFPLLVMVDTLDPNTNAPDGGSEITLGASNALTLPAGSTQKHYYLAPPAEVFAAFERRIEETVKEMYRQGRVEFVRPAGSQNESGIARKHAFQQTNTAIESFAKCIAEWERDTYVTVGRLLGIEEAKLAEIRVIAPDDFDVDDIDAALKQCEAAFALKLGPTFNATMKKRIAGELLPDVSDETKAIIDEEIDAAENDAASSDAMAKPVDPFADVTDPNVQVPPAA